MSDEDVPHPCKCRSCGCRPTRREFLQAVGAGAAAAFVWPLPVWAAETSPDFEKLVPADKKLSPEWVKSLTARGTRTVYKGDDLKWIGMPIGGLCAGQVYLGGDGKLWHWDIFNIVQGTGDGTYAHPRTPSSPFDQGFAIRVAAGGKTVVKALDRAGFPGVTFCGEYPIGYVEYADADVPVSVSLEAFSPFIPLSTDDSSLPAIVMQFTVKNKGNEKAEVDLVGWLENAVGCKTGKPGEGKRKNHVEVVAGATVLECSAEPEAAKEEGTRPDVVFEDFEKETCEGWTVEGTAFGKGPILRKQIPAYQGDVGGEGDRVVNSHNTRQGEDVLKGDAHTGKLTSKPFKIERNYITFYIGGGGHAGKTCMNLLVDGKAARTATGRNNNRMQKEMFDVRDLAGKEGRIEIVDAEPGPWGNIGVDQIVFSDKPAKAEPLADRPDFGTMALGTVGPAEGLLVAAASPDTKGADGLFGEPGSLAQAPGDSKTFGQKLRGTIGRRLVIEPGKQAQATFILAWHFPNLRLDGLAGTLGRRYGRLFGNATAVVGHVAANLEKLAARTRLWHDTWYDATLPYWFLDRTFLNTSILATGTAYRFANGRFYGWEGVGCCTGTCGHVWHYAHAPARLFPELERVAREMADYGVAFDDKTGAIDFRGEFHNGYATDGQAGTILRMLREHQMSADDGFLQRNWPKVRKSVEFLIQQDANGDGIIENGQPNTLDTTWFGPVAWLSGLYLASLRAGEEMARDAGDDEFAKRCRAIFDTGSKKIADLLWNGEYFIHKPDPAHADAMKSGGGCEIDQVFGQSWAFQVGLGRVFPEEKTRKALQSLYRYNFTMDVGPFRAVNKGGRWYAMPGEGGLLMCTWPKGGGQEAGGKAPAWAAGYFNECMNGFEYQAAGHMIWEGLLTEGLAVCRALHDRYSASRRNPWNEIECGEHYARSMASYGVYLAACGYEHHGPKGHLGFAPRLGADDFRAAFTAAEGWGTFVQKRDGAGLKATVDVKYGKLALKTLALALADGAKAKDVAVTVGGKKVGAALAAENGRALITLAEKAAVAAGEKVEVVVG